MNRKIIHVDMDCFYAQVEMRDRPSLKHLPIAVGGKPGTRSVLCTSNYRAREFGVKSAMPTDFAMRLCPKLIVIEPNFKKYKEASDLIHQVFRKYSDVIEGVSLDEAYLDVTHHANATLIAQKIKDDIFSVTKLTASVGLAPNKFLAKVASDWKKPNGLFVIKPQDISSFVSKLPVKFIPGVGKKTLETLNNLGAITCSDLGQIPPEVLALHFGKFSLDLFHYSRGQDNRPVYNEWERKSLSVENTYLKDLENIDEIKEELPNLLMELTHRLGRSLIDDPDKKIKKVFIKLKYADFKQSTCEQSIIPFLPTIDNFEKKAPFTLFSHLIEHTLAKRSGPIRLIGVGVKFLTSEEVNPIQLSFFDFCA